MPCCASTWEAQGCQKLLLCMHNCHNSVSFWSRSEVQQCCKIRPATLQPSLSCCLPPDAVEVPVLSVCTGYYLQGLLLHNSHLVRVGAAFFMVLRVLEVTQH